MNGRQNRVAVYPQTFAAVDRRWHRPSAIAIVFTLFGIAFFGSLCVWQLSRAAEKQRLFAAFAGAAEQAPVALDAARRDVDPLHYPLVHVRGRYDTTHTYELDDQTREGKVGTDAFAIFAPTDGSTPLLVERGFVARDARGERPTIPPPPDGDQDVTALYAPPPGTGLRLGGNALPRQTTWPKRSIYLDVGEIAADAGRTLDAKILRLAPDPSSGFVREWRPNVFPPERHYAYALTWFALAAIVAGVFVGMHWRKDETT